MSNDNENKENIEQANNKGWWKTKSAFLIYTKFILVILFFSLHLNNQQGLAYENCHLI